MNKFDILYKSIINEQGSNIERLKKDIADIESREADQAHKEVEGGNDPDVQKTLKKSKAQKQVELDLN